MTPTAPARTSTRPRSRRRARAAALALALALAGASTAPAAAAHAAPAAHAVLRATPPAPPQLSADATGDPALAGRARAAAAGLAVQGLAVAEGDAAGGRSAALGRADARPGRERAMTAGTPQEVGSVAKALTGLLLAEAVARGEVTASTTLAEVHADRDLPAELGRTTLAELATHTSGLPRLSTRAQLRALVTDRTLGNPYAWDTPESLLADAGGTPLRTPRGEYSYSNLGHALLGQALAVRAGVPYPRLLRERVLEPLGAGATAALPDPLPAGRAREVAPDGRGTRPWLSTGSAPAGTGVFSTAEDLGRLAAAAASGRLPGAAALEPRVEAEGMRAGWGWFTATLDGRAVVGVNGATYGAQASVWCEPATGRWVAVTAPTGPGAQPAAQTVALRLLLGADPGA
ncbi:serine hydrolase domain-containing protein [Kineococcus sp. SYSU DK005]|uniref:serine hydrolase domain-containing protein n=1 Tax=Kineococcus sp. SYSU DK005 TaxID=3383126 RepID=UPI003D7D17B7